MRFQDIPYQRPNKSEALRQYDAILAKLSTAKSAVDQLSAFADYQLLSRELSTQSTACMIRHTIDTRDEFYDKENDFFDAAGPLFSEKQTAIYKEFLKSPYRAELEQTLGHTLFEKLELAARSMCAEITGLMQEENALESEYQKLYAAAKVEFQGAVLTLPQLGAFKQSPDRKVRRAAVEAEGEWFDNQREQLDDLYTRLVKNRTAQAQRMGYKAYTPLAYLRMGRAGYGRPEVEEFRRQVKADWVPLAARVKGFQRTRIGVEKLHLYDDAFSFPHGNARPKGTPQQLLENAIHMYRALSPETGEFIDFMTQNGLFDLVSKPGKAPGGYCTYISGYQSPFVFSNFNGTSADVDVLTHEAGHAFAAYRAAKKNLPVELEEATMEACEVHSMSMEFLTSPWHNLFFGDDAPRYQLQHAEEAVTFIPYGCQVDEFQHVCYDEPGLKPEERNRLWLELEKQYRPWLELSGLPFYGRGAGWQRQLHIYECPFYYIDYCLAQTLALQFFALSLQDAPAAWQKYLAFVDLAGSESYTGLGRKAGLLLPFDPGCMKTVGETVTQWIAARQPNGLKK